MKTKTLHSFPPWKAREKFSCQESSQPGIHSPWSWGEWIVIACPQLSSPISDQCSAPCTTVRSGLMISYLYSVFTLQSLTFSKRNLLQKGDRFIPPTISQQWCITSQPVEMSPSEEQCVTSISWISYWNPETHTGIWFRHQRESWPISSGVLCQLKSILWPVCLDGDCPMPCTLANLGTVLRKLPLSHILFSGALTLEFLKRSKWKLGLHQTLDQTFIR